MGVQHHSDADARGLFHLARALIVAEPPSKFSRIKNYFDDLLPFAEQHGLILRVLVHSKSEVSQISAIKEAGIKRSGRGWSIETFYAQRLADVAEKIAREYVGPQHLPKTIIKCTSGSISNKKRILLRRAFYDCSKVLLEPLRGGKASEGVFLAHAWIEGAFLARRPLPFFVKFAGVSDIEVERQNYRLWVEPYIPFQLRPNVNHRRCVRGSMLSALVGNFVEDAIPLREALRKGVASGTLFSLFEVTLKGLRAQPFARTALKTTAGLDMFVRRRVRVQELEKRRPEVIGLARKLGLKSTPREMEEKLCEEAKDVSYWQGPMHGDLHDGNVMVRRSDAIVIDFGSIDEWGPLTADPAALEVSLAFRTDDADRSTFKEWRIFINKAYDCIPRLRPPNPESDPTPMSWLHRALREIRHILFGCDCADKEAAIVLASYLMRFARLSLEDLKSQRLFRLALQRHAYALVVAERIVAVIPKL